MPPDGQRSAKWRAAPGGADGAPAGAGTGAWADLTACGVAARVGAYVPGGGSVSTRPSDRIVSSDRWFAAARAPTLTSADAAMSQSVSPATTVWVAGGGSASDGRAKTGMRSCSAGAPAGIGTRPDSSGAAPDAHTAQSNTAAVRLHEVAIDPSLVRSDFGCASYVRAGVERLAIVR